MTNQQKIEFYLSKRFAVEAITKYNEKMTIYFKTCKYFTGIKGRSSVAVECDGHFVNNDIKSVTPIPPKPYKFKVGQEVIIKGGAIGKIKSQWGNAGYNVLIDEDEQIHSWWELAPALPEDEECEVVEVTEFDYNWGMTEFTGLKLDGKKLKIRVISNEK